MPAPKETRKKRAARYSTVLVGFLFALSAHGASFTVADGQTTGGQMLDTAGDTGTIESGGAIETMMDDDDGVDASGARVVIVVESGGRIAVTGEMSSGILSSGEDAVITNRGTISTAGATRITGNALLTRNTAAGIDSRGADARITNAGELMTSGRNAYGVIAFGADTNIINRGKIITTGALSAGIASPGDFVMIDNFGEIDTQGDDAWGIVSRGDDARIDNHFGGSITTAGERAHGIHSERFNDPTTDATDAKITNAGRITTAGDRAHGINSAGARVNIYNTGSITTTGARAHGINSDIVNDPTTDATDAKITNAGRITTAGDGAHGINAAGERVNIYNTGSIITTGDESHGIRVVSKTDSTLTVSGEISASGADSRAIYVTGDGNTTLTLRNARILGAIDLGGGDNTVVIERTATPSSVLTIESDIPIVLGESSPWGFARGNTMTTIDPSGFSAHRATLLAATRRIHQAVSHRQAARGAWAQVFGGRIERDYVDLSLAWEQDFQGVLGGYQSARENGGHLGWFGGIGTGQTETETRSIETDSNELFGGVYGRRERGDWGIDGALALGYSRHDGERTVTDNLAGIETAKADYRSFYISPSIALTRHRKLASGLSFHPNIRLAWTHAQYDDYTEHGTTNANLKVHSRNEEILDGQVQMLMAYTFAGGVTTELRGGATLRYYDSERVDFTGGDPGNHEIPGDDSITGVYGGIAVRYATKFGRGPDWGCSV